MNGEYIRKNWRLGNDRLRGFACKYIVWSAAEVNAMKVGLRFSNYHSVAFIAPALLRHGEHSTPVCSIGYHACHNPLCHLQTSDDAKASLKTNFQSGTNFCTKGGRLVYPSSYLGWRYSANGNPHSRHQPN